MSTKRFIHLLTKHNKNSSNNYQIKRYKLAKIRKRRNQKKIPTPKNEIGKKLNQQSGTYTMETYHKSNGQLFSQKVTTQLSKLN